LGDRVDALYREVVLEHYRHPRGRDPLADPQGRALVDNPVCGDQVKVEVSVENGRVGGVSARARGCAIAVAAASVMTELVPGLDREGCAELERGLADVLAGGAPAPALDPRLAAFERIAELPSRTRCALLPWEALREAWPGAD
jgi:nitrogen fixation NifU-like protein